jgi:hypothetical protein
VFFVEWRVRCGLCSGGSVVLFVVEGPVFCL